MHTNHSHSVTSDTRPAACALTLGPAPLCQLIHLSAFTESECFLPRSFRHPDLSITLSVQCPCTQQWPQCPRQRYWHLPSVHCPMHTNHGRSVPSNTRQPSCGLAFGPAPLWCIWPYGVHSIKTGEFPTAPHHLHSPTMAVASRAPAHTCPWSSIPMCTKRAR